MILELGDGREIQLPDEMEDEQARQLKGFILGAEERAKIAEKSERLHREEMVGMRKELAGMRDEMKSMRAMKPAPQAAAPVADDGLAAARHKEMLDALERLTAAVYADRVLLPDEYGEGARSRVVRD